MRKYSVPLHVWILLFLMPLLLGMVATAVPTQGQQTTAWQKQFSYLSPRPEAEMVSASTTISVRDYSGDGAALHDALNFTVSGSQSGRHFGETVLGQDGQTVIFRPFMPFHTNERVSVDIDNGETITSYSFKITAGLSDQLPAVDPFDWEEIELPDNNQAEAQAAQAPPPFRTAPPNLPRYDITKGAGTAGNGYIFLSPFDFTTFGGEVAYLMILDNKGEPVFYRQFDGQAVMDFKRQPNGQLTYYDRAERLFFGLNNQYEIVQTYAAGNGYPTNMHDLQILDDGSFLLTIYDSQIIDMSEIVEGGQPDAQVLGCIVQELDAQSNVLFEWRSWDHIDITETTRDLTFQLIDYIHCNSIERDSDNHLLLSSRNIDEITKIDRQTGDMIWRMGGKKNDFSFLNGGKFSRQHDARRLANGHMTLYDNGVTHDPQRSRGLEIEVVEDEGNESVKVINEYRNTPDTYARYMGDLQRLPNGNTVIGWGYSSSPTYTEFDVNGGEVLEFNGVVDDVVSYRAFRFPWQGYPTWPPALIANADGRDVELFFSWNGSTETSGYMIFAEDEGGSQWHVDTVGKDGFENSYQMQVPSDGVWKFWVVAINQELEQTKASKVVSLLIGGRPFYLPVIGSRDD